MTGRRHYTPRLTDRAGRRRGTAGWDYVHIAIDDCTRLAYAEVLTDEKASTAIAFLARAVAFYRRHGITVERLLTDNGSAYRATIHALACRALGIRHLRTRPRGRRPTERQSASSAPCSAAGPTARSTASDRERTAALDGWLWTYNHRRRHSAIGRQPPISRLNNLLGSYT